MDNVAKKCKICGLKTTNEVELADKIAGKSVVDMIIKLGNDKNFYKQNVAKNVQNVVACRSCVLDLVKADDVVEKLRSTFLPKKRKKKGEDITADRERPEADNTSNGHSFIQNLLESYEANGTMYGSDAKLGRDLQKLKRTWDTSNMNSSDAAIVSSPKKRKPKTPTNTDGTPTKILLNNSVKSQKAPKSSTPKVSSTSPGKTKLLNQSIKHPEVETMLAGLAELEKDSRPPSAQKLKNNLPASHLKANAPVAPTPKKKKPKAESTIDGPAQNTLLDSQKATGSAKPKLSTISPGKAQFANITDETELADNSVVSPVRYKCKLCPLDVKSVKKLKKHLQKVHNVVEDANDVEVPVRHQFQKEANAVDANHTQPHGETKPHISCTLCGKQFKQLGRLRTHMVKLHGGFSNS